MDRSYLEENGVDVNSALSYLGDMDMYNETISDFYNDLSMNMKKLKDFKDSVDMPNYAILVHSMKSDSKYLGFTHLSEICLNHEMKSKENDVNYVNENFAELEEEVNKISDLIKNYLK